MSSHGVGNLVTIALAVIFIVSAIRRQLSRVGAPAARAPVVPSPPLEPLARRRLAPPQAKRPLVPPAVPPPARVTIVPSMAETLPAEAAAAFPALDLSLPDTPGVPAATGPRRRLRSIGAGPALGSPGWGVNAVLATEILGPPVSLRAGATLGAPHAF
jgi:cell division septation protein DedD